MDMQMPVLNGCQSARVIAQNYPGVKIVMLSTFDRRAYVEEATRSGTWGYLVKSMRFAELLEAIYQINQGQRVFCEEALRVQQEDLGASDIPVEISVLSDREQEVLNLMAEGLPNSQIGKRLNLSEATIKYHVSKLLKHFHLRSRTQLISYLYWLQSKQ
jgi:DNA-binding NarL/FixJ family response regulator